MLIFNHKQLFNWKVPMNHFCYTKIMKWFVIRSYYSQNFHYQNKFSFSKSVYTFRLLFILLLTSHPSPTVVITPKPALLRLIHPTYHRTGIHRRTEDYELLPAQTGVHLPNSRLPNSMKNSPTLKALRTRLKNCLTSKEFYRVDFLGESYETANWKRSLLLAVARIGK